MCRENSIEQIHAAIDLIKNAENQTDLINAQTQALSFIQAAAEQEDITYIEKNNFQKQVRRIYRNQLIEESA